MGSLYKQKYTCDLPENYEIKIRKRKATAKELRANPSHTTVEEKIVRWRDKTGQLIEGVLKDGHVLRTATTWTAKFKDSDGLTKRLPTGCREKDNAKEFLAEKERLVERIKVGVLTQAEVSTADASKSAIDDHLEAYLKSLEHKRGKGKRERVSDSHLINVRRSLFRIVRDCQFSSLRDVSREAVEQWVTGCLENSALDWSARTINSHVEALKAFCAWCVEAKPQRLQANPLFKFPMLGEDAKRPRRALNFDEIDRLLTVVRLRPIAEFGRETVPKKEAKKPSAQKSRATWTKAPLTIETIQSAFELGHEALRKSPAKIAALTRLGEDRELLYKVLLTTGMRQGELKSITIGQCRLDETPAWLDLRFQDEKSGRGAKIPLREDVAHALRQHVDRRRTEMDQRIQSGSDTGTSLSDELLLTVPDKLVRILDRDLAAAGIPKTDERGLSVDVHAMRHTFATMLTTSGVLPRVAQEAMRHSTIELTMKRYTDPKLLDIASAIESMPAFPSRSANRDGSQPRGHRSKPSRELTPTLTPNSVQGSQNLSLSDTFGGEASEESGHEKTPVFLGNTEVFDSRGEPDIAFVDEIFLCRL